MNGIDRQPAGQAADAPAPDADIVLAGHDLVKSFGGFVAIDGVTLNVRRGSIHALIGPNGAGKTTLFNLLTKFHTLTSGQLLFEGRDITAMKPAEIARLGIVRSFQISAVFDKLTVLQNLRVALQRKAGNGFTFWQSENRMRRFDEEAFALLREVGLEGYAHQQASSLPYGRKRALELAATLALDPKVLLLDEPMAGMAHEDIERVVELIRHVAKSRTVLMVEHNLSVVSTLSDRITVLARGQILADGDYDTVSKNPDVVSAYLGEGLHA